MTLMTDATTHYIEVIHTYDDTRNPAVTLHTEEVYWAVSPTPTRGTATGHVTADEDDPDGEDSVVSIEVTGPRERPWALFGGSSVYIQDLEDIKGLRKLLDKIESAYILDEMGRSFDSKE